MSEAAATGRPEKECDLVMKGGITSGVVYPGAIRKIAAKYRFRNLGGASAGAIAAVAAAACEYRRNQGVEDAYDVLGEVSAEISKPGFVQGLFQPRPKARPAFEVALGLATSSGSLNRRLFTALVSILGARRRFVLWATVAVLLWAAVVAVGIWAIAAGGLGALEIVAVVLLAVVALPIAALLVAVVAAIALTRFVTELDRALKGTWFGMCSGRTEEGHSQPGLTDWLHSTIQKCAGLPEDRPLTFGDLRGDDPDDPDVNLQLITTDLSASRPATLPLPEWPQEEPSPYLFDPAEFAQLFPQAIVDHMGEAAGDGARTSPDGRTLYPVPGLDLPIVVAARLSLSFPILLATVPFWRADGLDGAFVQHTMSDGGISSNFPIHYFDSLFPGRPTFGLDLQPWRVKRETAVEMSNEPRKPGFSEVGNVATFFTQILNAARNWRDNMQAELPGYRDRICQIRLSKEEGGLNLNMPREIVERLLERGEEAGAEVINPDRFDWDRHRITRFWTMMQLLQQSLGPPGFGRPGVYSGEYPGRTAFKNVVEQWLQSGKGPEPPALDWWTKAIPASDKVFELAEEWADFAAEAPTPTPTLRILPRV
jgi:predicted acylesterase/phospholipase RssA